MVPGNEVMGAGSRAPAQVLFLGTYHFANSGLDVVQIEVADILFPSRQAEVVGVVEALGRFQPTKIAVEVLPQRATHLITSKRFQSNQWSSVYLRRADHLKQLINDWK